MLDDKKRYGHAVFLWHPERLSLIASVEYAKACACHKNYVSFVIIRCIEYCRLGAVFVLVLDN